MIIKDNTNQDVERMKANLGLSGNVYLYNNHFMESLKSHKNLITSSTATTIEEAYAERVQYETELAEKRRIEAEQYALEHPEEFENMEE